MKKIAVVLILAVAFCFVLVAFNSNNVLAAPATKEIQIAIGKVLIGQGTWANLADGRVQIKQDGATPYMYGSSTTFPITISQPGSYVLTSDITVSGTGVNGIRIEADNVTLDLNGFSLIGSGALIGVYILDVTDVEIRNGTVRNFDSRAISCSQSGKGIRIIGIRAISNGGGITIDSSGCLVKGCTAVDNDGDGIRVYQGATVTGNTCNGNVTGIYAVFGCTIIGNTCSYNNASGISTSGGGNTIRENTCYMNGWGIGSTQHASVIGNTVMSNQYDGIWLTMDCYVDQNTAINNNRSGGGYVNITSCATCTFGTNHAPATP